MYKIHLKIMVNGQQGVSYCATFLLNVQQQLAQPNLKSSSQIYIYTIFLPFHLCERVELLNKENHVMFTKFTWYGDTTISEKKLINSSPNYEMCDVHICDTTAIHSKKHLFFLNEARIHRTMYSKFTGLMPHLWFW